MIPNYGRRGRGLKIENGMILIIEPMINVGTYKVAIIPNGWTVIKEMVKQLFWVN